MIYINISLFYKCIFVSYHGRLSYSCVKSVTYLILMLCNFTFFDVFNYLPLFSNKLQIIFEVMWKFNKVPFRSSYINCPAALKKMGFLSNLNCLNLLWEFHTWTPMNLKRFLNTSFICVTYYVVNMCNISGMWSSFVGHRFSYGEYCN